MVISQVIAELERLRAIYGDKPVLWVDPETGTRLAFTIAPGIGARGQGTVMTLSAEGAVQGREGGPWPTRIG